MAVKERERERFIRASFGVLVEYLGSRYRGQDWHGNVVVHLNLTANLPLNLFENLLLGMKEARLWIVGFWGKIKSFLYLAQGREGRSKVMNCSNILEYNIENSMHAHPIVHLGKIIAIIVIINYFIKQKLGLSYCILI